MGDQFVLDSQINVLNVQQEKFEKQRNGYNKDSDYTLKKIRKEYEALNRDRFDLEQAIRNLNAELDRENQECYENTMQLRKEKVFDDIESITY